MFSILHGVNLPSITATPPKVPLKRRQLKRYLLQREKCQTVSAEYAKDFGGDFYYFPVDTGINMNMSVKYMSVSVIVGQNENERSH